MNTILTKEKNEFQFLTERKKYDIQADPIKDNEKIDYTDISLYHITELTYEEKSPRREAFENIISSFREDGISFLYLLIGDKKKVSFYLGVVRDKSSKNPSIDIKDIGDKILKPTIEGNFRGSKVQLVDRHSKNEILNSMSYYNNFGIIDGIPGINEGEDKSSFQGIDRLVDVMLGDSFTLGILVNPIDRECFKEIEDRLYMLYANISPLIKQTLQQGKNSGKNSGESVSENISKSTNLNKGSSDSENWSYSEGTNKSVTKGTNKGTNSSNTSSSSSSGKNSGTSNSGTEGSSTTNGYSKTSGGNTSEGHSDTQGFTESKNKGTSTGNSSTLGIELINKNAQEWIKYIDEMLFPMMDYGRSKGLYLTTTFIFTENRTELIKLGATIQSLFSGRKGNKMALQLEELEKNSLKIEYLKNFQIPKCEQTFEKNRCRALVAESKLAIDNTYKFANIYSPNEISILTGLPKKEVIGLSLKEEVEFGLNFPKNEDTNNIELGYLIQTGRHLKNIKVSVNKNDLDKHIFIAGVTGSGKTTTCHKILKKSNLPFLVIEPAKTEYRVLIEENDNILIFTLGKDTIAPFRINPFEFFPHESITSRVDMVKGSIEASFDMEAAIPQLIEQILYRCYEDYGWNIATNKNSKFKDPFAHGVYSFPTLKDIINRIESVVNSQGFDNRLKSDYIGSIKARLQSLIIGSKGLMLNTPRSIDFKELLENKVILELEEVKNASEKSLIMGFVLGNLSEALKAKHKENKNFKHITLIEEAHRLLSKFIPGDSPNKKQGVELFSDMLAEVRKYGESLIIVDQIPNKLTPEVLKNTNTKIVHKIFAEDDKEAIGNTMALSNEQKKYLSSLRTGEVIVFSQGWDKAVQSQIEKETDTTGKDEIEDHILHNNILKFYSKNYKNGVIIGTQILKEEPSLDFINMYLVVNQSFYAVDEFIKLMKGPNLIPTMESDEKLKLKNSLIECYNECSKNIDILTNFMYCKFYLKNNDIALIEPLKEILLFLIQCKNDDIGNVIKPRDRKLFI